MNVVRAFKTELDLSNVQKTACAQHAGTARYAYNWGLSRKIQAYQAGEKVPTSVDLHRELNVLKKTEFSWMYAVSKCAPQEALRNLDQAYEHFFRRVKEKKSGHQVKVGFPSYKSKKNRLGSFRLTGTIRVYDKAIQLPRLGRLKLKERGYLPVKGSHILSATVSEKAGRWFVSLLVEISMPTPKHLENPVVGVDLGINCMAQISDGTYFENPRALKKMLFKIKRLQRTATRRQNGSANHRKIIQRLAKAHFHVANIRKDAIHKATSLLAKTKSAVILEDLNVSGMLKNRRLAQAVSDVGFFEFRKQLIYKGFWYGCEVIIADRYYPSTKRCSNCGQIKPAMKLSERKYRCDCCGLVLDRDLNAAINLEQLVTT